MFSPFGFCNGTQTVERDHRTSMYAPDEDLGDFVFLDYAGSGVVHLCGKLISAIFHILIIVAYYVGGMASFMLQLFHKIERNVSKGK